MFIKTYTGNSYSKHCDGYRFTTEFNNINKKIKYSWYTLKDVQTHFENWTFKHQEKLKAFYKNKDLCKKILHKNFLEEKNFMYTAEPNIPFINLVNSLYFINEKYSDSPKKEYYEDVILEIYYSNKVHYESQKWGRGTAPTNNLPRDIRSCLLNNYIEYDLNSIAITSIYTLAEIIAHAKLRHEMENYGKAKKINFYCIKNYIDYKDEIRNEIDNELGYKGITKLVVNNITMGSSFNRYSKFFDQYIEDSDNNINKQNLVQKVINHEFFKIFKKELNKAIKLISDFLDFNNIKNLKKSEFSTFIYQTLESHIMFEFAKYLKNKNINHLVLHDGIYVKNKNKYFTEKFIEFELKIILEKYFIDFFKKFKKFNENFLDIQVTYNNVIDKAFEDELINDEEHKKYYNELYAELYNVKGNNYNKRFNLKHISVNKSSIVRVLHHYTFSCKKIHSSFKDWNLGSFNKVLQSFGSFKKTFKRTKNLGFNVFYYILYINSVKLFEKQREQESKKYKKFILKGPSPPTIEYFFSI